ncbi:MAG: hypothetical protein QXN55_08940 [Candidatus Nitrosotenuis sp.]
MSSNSGEYLTEEEAEKLEVTCGYCDRRIKIRSLGEHVQLEHSPKLGSKLELVERMLNSLEDKNH